MASSCAASVPVAAARMEFASERYLEYAEESSARAVAARRREEAARSEGEANMVILLDK